MFLINSSLEIKSKMKTKIKYISLLLMFSISILIIPQKTSAQVTVSYQVFYDDLSPYGTWVDNPYYGYVWIPSVDAGFTPYATNGYWIFTDQGWTWVSNYSWGWAPFHYGRWYTDSFYGPVWIPGNEWGPGWVTWRRSNDYYGWSPMEPGVSYAAANGSGYYPSHNHWTIMKGKDLGRKNIDNYYINSSNNETIINNSTVINNVRVDKSHNVTYNAGPDKTDVEKHIGKSITPVSVKESNKPGQSITKDQFQIYRPQVQKNSSTGTKPAPAKVTSLKDVKTPEQKTTKTTSQKTNQETKQNVQQVKQQSQTKPTVKPTKQQPETKQYVQPIQQKQLQNKQTVQPAKQQQTQPKQNVQPDKQQQSQPKQENSSGKGKK